MTRDQRRAGRTVPAAAPWLRSRSLWCAAACVALLAWVVDGCASAVATGLIAAATVQGLRLGAIELAGLALGTVAALLVAMPVGHAIEPGIAALTGLSGLVKRGVSILLVAGALMAVGGFAGRVLFRSVVTEDSPWRRRNSMLGALVGLVQGVALAVGLSWVVLAVRPVAAARVVRAPVVGVGEEGGYERRRESASRIILSLADELTATVLGRIAAATNPFTSLRTLVLAEAFAQVSRDPYALRVLLASEPMARLRRLESYNQAATLANGDVELMSFFTGEGVDAATLGRLVVNDTILLIMDKTTIVADIEPMADQLERAVLSARDQVGRGPPELIDPIDDHSPGRR